jgi:integrase
VVATSSAINMSDDSGVVQSSLKSLDEASASSNMVASSQGKRKSMAQRSGQSGTVVVKGGMWHGRYYEDVSGQIKRKRKSIPIGLRDQMTKPEARRKLRAMLEEMGVNTSPHLERSLRPSQIFSSYADWWEKNIQPMHQPSSQNSSHYILKKHLRARFGLMPMDSITHESVQEWIADLQSEGKLKPRSIKNVWKVLRLILGKQRVKDWTIRLPKNPKKEQRWFTPEEMQKIIDAAWGQYKCLFQLAWATAMRSGELFGLKVEDLDLENAIVHIRRSAWQHLEVTPKTDAGHRDVDIDAATVEMLKEHLGDRKIGLVFPSKNGTPLVNRNVNVDVLRVICKRLRIQNGGLHAIRHGRISFLQAMGVPGDLIVKWVGHTSLKMTSVYTHFSDQFRKETVSRLVPSSQSQQP